jgi:hypothetical protein
MEDDQAQDRGEECDASEHVNEKEIGEQAHFAWNMLHSGIIASWTIIAEDVLGDSFYSEFVTGIPCGRRVESRGALLSMTVMLDRMV